MSTRTINQHEVLQQLEEEIARLNQLHTDAILHRLYVLANALMPVLGELRNALAQARHRITEQ